MVIVWTWKDVDQMTYQFETQNEGLMTVAQMQNGKPTLLVFVRHLGWPICREFLTQLREQAENFTKLGVAIIVVAPSKAEFIKQFLEAFGPFPFPIVGDPKRAAYKGMGHQTMPKWKLLSMATFGFLTGKVKEFFPKDEHKKKFVLSSMKTQDVYIQGGSWLLSASGDVLWKHIDKSPQDHAKLSTIKKYIEKTLL